jgi:agmatinase
MAILQASRFVELLDEDRGDVPAEAGIHTLPFLEPRAAGPGASHQEIGDMVRWLLKAGKMVGALGGEHSLTFPVIAAYREHYPDISVLQIDAHGDLRKTYHGSELSHACVMRRIVELGVPTVGLGIRSVCSEEVEFIRDRSLVRFSGRDVVRRTKPLNEMLSGLTEQVYVTLDLDGFDPSLAPGVGTPEPGGLGWFDFLDVLDALKGRRIVGFDVVELLPLPGQISTDFLAARSAYKLAGQLLRGGS